MLLVKIVLAVNAATFFLQVLVVFTVFSLCGMAIGVATPVESSVLETLTEMIDRFRHYVRMFWPHVFRFDGIFSHRWCAPISHPDASERREREDFISPKVTTSGQRADRMHVNFMLTKSFMGMTSRRCRYSS
jgi:hypothetical protein